MAQQALFAQALPYLLISALALALLILIRISSAGSAKREAGSVGSIALSSAALAGLPPAPIFFAKLGLLVALYSRWGPIALAWALSTLFMLWLAILRFVLVVAAGSNSSFKAHRGSARARQGSSTLLLVLVIASVLVAVAPIAVVALV